MMRRATWLAIGAVLGIAGYRRATKAVRALLPLPEMLAPLGPRAAGNGQARPASRRRGAAAGTAEFVRDVRAGMTEYLDRHSEP